MTKAFLFGVAPEDFFFDIASHEYLCETRGTTNHEQRGCYGSYKHTIRTEKPCSNGSF